MQEHLIAILATLRERTHFEDAATLLLRSVIDTAAATLASSEHDIGNRIVRAMVHHRPADGDRRLAVLDREATEVTMTGVKEAYLPSAAAWKWIVLNRQPASIDVNLALIQAEVAGGPAPTTDAELLNAGVTSQESRLRLLRRGATHVYVMPLLGMRGSVDGLVSIEAHCPSAIGQSF